MTRTATRTDMLEAENSSDASRATPNSSPWLSLSSVTSTLPSPTPSHHPRPIWSPPERRFVAAADGSVLLASTTRAGGHGGGRSGHVQRHARLSEDGVVFPKSGRTLHRRRRDPDLRVGVGTSRRPSGKPGAPSRAEPGWSRLTLPSRSDRAARWGYRNASSGSVRSVRRRVALLVQSPRSTRSPDAGPALMLRQGLRAHSSSLSVLLRWTTRTGAAPTLAGCSIHGGAATWPVVA